MNAVCVVAFVAYVNTDKFSIMYLILIKSLVHGHGRCTHLGTCLVYTPCVVDFVAYENADKFSVMYFILLKSVVHGHGRGTRLGTCLVQLQYVSYVIAPVACVTADKCNVLLLIT